MALITVAQYKTYAGISGTGDDTRLAVIIAEAEAAFRRQCSRDMSNGFEAATRTEDYYADSAELQLREFPITSVTSVTPIANDNTLGSALDSGLYRVDLQLGLITFNGAQNGRVVSDADSDRELISTWEWVPRFNRVRVVYVTGAAAADQIGALYRITDMLYNSIRRDPTIASQNLGGWSISYAAADQAAAHVLNLIRPFRGGGVL